MKRFSIFLLIIAIAAVVANNTEARPLSLPQNKGKTRMHRSASKERTSSAFDSSEAVDVVRSFYNQYAFEEDLKVCENLCKRYLTNRFFKKWKRNQHLKESDINYMFSGDDLIINVYGSATYVKKISNVNYIGNNKVKVSYIISEYNEDPVECEYYCIVTVALVNGQYKISNVDY